MEPIPIFVGDDEAVEVPANLRFDPARMVAGSASADASFRPIVVPGLPEDDHRQPHSIREAAAASLGHIFPLTQQRFYPA